MKIIRKNEKRGFSHLERPSTWCCNKMEKATKEDFIHMRYEFDDLMLNGMPGCFIETRGYGQEIDYTKIDFCPFCGEKIEIIK